ncbi:uncharacterized protein LOC110442368 [Mizuhopecten yessoensis]|uniref:Uncharacterized protein n=1 Tax=Mizuhopecten yessoensis TaxID=6573 RepID=A0A210PHD9_MIZYE|nr:uncharacterized protein LOC110442368 [Mizuhopecten yessoensis]XP_021341615.1 uncharacterized protein LOC110442368 [Mizuhopecten yessoensis]OWF35905.1 hypothetical protein KP79_PYT09728 [Mizuhopecten yessoensis]
MDDKINRIIVQHLTANCQEVPSNHQSPNWTRLRPHFRIIKITSNNELFIYLDSNSREKKLNWLIFSRVGDQIIVTHFGPLGKKKDNDFDDKVDQTRRSLKTLKDIWILVSSSCMPKEEKEVKQNATVNGVKEKFLVMMQAVKEQIEAKKEEIEKAIMIVFESEEERKHIRNEIIKITTENTKALVEKVLKAVIKKIRAKIAKGIVKTATKQALKQGAKAVSKGTAKTTAKAVPVVGLALGTVYGIWRLVNGDVAGAGLELASGVASTVPVVGTAVSVAIDTGLVAKDVKDVYDLTQERNKKLKALKVDFERIEGDLNDLLTKYDTAKAEYDFVCEVLGDKEYDYEKLEHDIGVVDQVWYELHNNCELF